MPASNTLTTQPPAPAVETRNTYNYAIGYLRGFIVLLVVAHHAALAYHPFAPPPPASFAAQPRWWQAFPVVDPRRGDWASLFAGFNDAFFMALMFFLSGLFVWSGVQRKGTGAFLRGRLLRLGLPFLAAAAIIAPLAYYPTYLQMGHTGLSGYARQWFSMDAWPAGPAWFLWVLVVFDCIAALLFAAAPQWAERFGKFLAGPQGRPARFFLLLAAGSALVYLPLELVFNGLNWTAFGPFTFQTSRILHYLLYFLAGAGLGAWGIERGPLMPQGKLARRWPLWAGAAAVVFVVSMGITVAFITAHLQSPGCQEGEGAVVDDIGAVSQGDRDAGTGEGGRLPGGVHHGLAVDDQLALVAGQAAVGGDGARADELARVEGQQPADGDVSRTDQRRDCSGAQRERGGGDRVGAEVNCAAVERDRRDRTGRSDEDRVEVGGGVRAGPRRAPRSACCPRPRPGR